MKAKGKEGLTEQTRWPHHSPKRKINEELTKLVMQLRGSRNIGIRRLNVNFFWSRGRKVISHSAYSARPFFAEPELPRLKKLMDWRTNYPVLPERRQDTERSRTCWRKRWTASKNSVRRTKKIIHHVQKGVPLKAERPFVFQDSFREMFSKKRKPLQGILYLLRQEINHFLV